MEIQPFAPQTSADTSPVGTSANGAKGDLFAQMLGQAATRAAERRPEIRKPDPRPAEPQRTEAREPAHHTQARPEAGDEKAPPAREAGSSAAPARDREPAAERTTAKPHDTRAGKAAAKPADAAARPARAEHGDAPRNAEAPDAETAADPADTAGDEQTAATSVDSPPMPVPPTDALPTTAEPARVVADTPVPTAALPSSGPDLAAQMPVAPSDADAIDPEQAAAPAPSASIATPPAPAEADPAVLAGGAAEAGDRAAPTPADPSPADPSRVPDATMQAALEAALAAGLTAAPSQPAPADAAAAAAQAVNGVAAAPPPTAPVPADPLMPAELAAMPAGAPADTAPADIAAADAAAPAGAADATPDKVTAPKGKADGAELPESFADLVGAKPEEASTDKTAKGRAAAARNDDGGAPRLQPQQNAAADTPAAVQTERAAIETVTAPAAERAVEGVAAAAAPAPAEAAGNKDLEAGHILPTDTVKAAAATEMPTVATVRPMRSPHLPMGVTDQVAVNIHKHVAEGNERFTIMLKPEELGRIDIRLEIAQDGRVTALVAVDRPQTLELLQRDQRGLERALQDAGLKADSDSLSFSLRDDGASPFGDRQGEGQRGTGRRGRGFGGGDETDEVAAMQTLTLAPGRVDVRV